MTGRERIRNSLTFKECDIVPIEARDCTWPSYDGPGEIVEGTVNVKGEYKDHWGCIWRALEDGVCGEVYYHPLEDWAALDTYKPPKSLPSYVNVDRLNRFCENTDCFAFPAGSVSMPNIFERMQHLRGTENLLMDIAYGDERLYTLRDMILEYYIPLMEAWGKTNVDAFHIADDWGTQTSMLISPNTWREFFKPIYKQFADIAHKNNKFILMHSDGFIEPILDDLVEIGINSINSQLFCMDIEKLAEKYHHKLTFWGEIDRQFIQPFGTPEDMKNAVRRVSNAFFSKDHTGFVAQCFFTKGTPQANQDAEWNEWKKISEEWHA